MIQGFFPGWVDLRLIWLDQIQRTITLLKQVLSANVSAFVKKWRS